MCKYHLNISKLTQECLTTVTDTTATFYSIFLYLSQNDYFSLNLLCLDMEDLVSGKIPDKPFRPWRLSRDSNIAILL